jgi:hypothetical protein
MSKFLANSEMRCISQHRIRGVRARLDGRTELQSADLAGAPRISELSMFVATVPWKISRGYREHAEVHHISLQEATEASCELPERVQLSAVPSRHLNIIDSRVVLGSRSQCRSSSFLLDGICRKNIGWSVLGRKRQCHLNLGSGDNVSGDPSRTEFSECLSQFLVG